jgi:hypothetical protein
MADMMAFDGLTVVDAMIAFGVDHEVLFLDETQAQCNKWVIKQYCAKYWGDL